MMARFLYRGVRASMYVETGGLLVPKAPGPVPSEFRRDGSVMRTRGADPRDNGAVRSRSVINTILKQQLRRKGYPTPAISTTPHQENARAYALFSEPEGYIYVIDVERLGGSDVTAYAVADFVPVPSVPDDEEVVLFARDGGTLPPDIVVDIIQVSR